MDKGRYNDGSYLKQNENWHAEDSEWKYRQFKEYLTSSDFKSVADIGCGAGVVLNLINNEFDGKELTGYDISDNVEKFWEGIDPKITFYNEDFFTFNEEQYDVIVSLDVLEHVENYYEFIKKIRGRGKHFIFHVPLDMFVLASLTNNYRRKKDELGHLHYYDKNTILEVFKDCGYKVKDYKFTKAYKVAKTGRAKKMRLLRTIGEKILGKDLNSRVLGGYSLIVFLE